MTAHAPHAGLAELRRKIGVAIRSALGAYTASEPRPVEEALALLATDRTIHPESLRILTEFYQGGAAHREPLKNTRNFSNPPLRKASAA